MEGPSNVEIKAVLRNREKVVNLCKTLTGSSGEILNQVDYFFKCERGRMKLRFLGDGVAELIYYDRPDESGPKVSKYHKCPVDGPGILKVLQAALDVTAIIKKERLLFMLGHTRIHIDTVESLRNDYLELEVVSISKDIKKWLDLFQDHPV